MSGTEIQRPKRSEEIWPKNYANVIVKGNRGFSVEKPSRLMLDSKFTVTTVNHELTVM